MNDDTLVDTLNNAWGWTGRRFIAITAVNPFGHMILKDDASRYSYCDPELLALTGIADNDETLFAYIAEPAVRELWESTKLVEQAKAALGELAPGHVYHWKIAPALGGAYEAHNIASLPLSELIAYAGCLAEQIKDLPDGAKIKLKVVE